MGIRSDRAIWEAESEGLELIDLTIGDLLDQQAAARPDHEAVVYRYPELGLDLRLTHRQYRDEVNRLAKGLLALGIEKGEHVAGCILHALGALTRGATLIPLITFDPAKQLELIVAEKATYSGGVPTMLIAMLNHPYFQEGFQAGEFDLSALRQMGSGGSPVPITGCRTRRLKRLTLTAGCARAIWRR